MASRYWVGGTGTWDASDTTHWASSSGGAGGQSVPGSGDTVTLDGSSGGGTITVNTDFSVTSLTMGAFTGTLDFATNNNSPTMQTFSLTGTGTRTLNMGSGTWTLTGNATTIWTHATATNLTLNVGTSIVNCTYSGSTGTRSISCANAAAGTVGATLNISAGSDTVSLTAVTSFNAKNLNFTGFTGVATFVASNISGNLTFGTGMSVTSTSAAITFVNTTSINITTNGVALNLPLVFNGAGGTYVFQDNISLSGASERSVTFSQGTLNLNGKTLTCATFVCNDNNVKTLTITNSTINITSVATGTQFNVANGSGGIPTNLTVNATGSTINFTGSTIGTTASHTFSGGGKTWNNLVFNGPMRPSISFSNTFNNLTFTGPSSKEGRMTIAVDQTVTGTYTVTGTATNRVLVIGAGTGFEGTQRTVTAAAVSFSYVDFQDIRISGAASPATGTSLGDCFNNTNITTNSPRTLYWVGNSGNWSDTAHWSTTSGGASGSACPLPQDTVIIDANSITLAGQTITIDVCRPCLNLDMSAVANSPVIAMRSSNVQGTTFYGNVIWSSSVTVTGADSVDLCTRTTANWNPGGITYPNSWVIRAANSGVVTQLGNFISSGSTGLSISLGKLVVNGNNNQTNTFTCATFTVGSGRNQEIDWGTGTWSLTGTGTILNVTSSGLVSTPNAGVLKITDSSASSKTIAGNGLSYPFLLVSGTGSGKIIITGSNSFTGLSDNNPTSHIIEFTAGTTQTIPPGGWCLNGAPGALLSIQSSSAGVPFTISISSGLVRAQYLSIKDSTATGGAYFQAVNSTNVSGNTGWNFVTERTPTYRVGQKFSTFGGTRPYKKALYGDLHLCRKLGG